MDLNEYVAKMFEELSGWVKSQMEKERASNEKVFGEVKRELVDLRDIVQSGEHESIAMLDEMLEKTNSMTKAADDYERKGAAAKFLDEFANELSASLNG